MIPNLVEDIEKYRDNAINHIQMILDRDLTSAEKSLVSTAFSMGINAGQELTNKVQEALQDEQARG